MIRLLLVEDQEIVRRGLKTLLETKPDLQVIGEASNGQQAIELMQSLQASPPDVILMDIRMPVLDGVTATQRICQEFPGTKILVLTTFDDTKYITEAIRYGAKGYILKDTPAEELAESIRLIHRGYTQFGPGILEKTIAQMSTTAPDKPELPPGMAELTAREREILICIATGSSNREIAQSLFLSEGTVRNHISHILTRLNLRDRTQAAIVANAFLSWLQKLNSAS
ncbi:response regulator transcription factor [Merismopedia glauca]|uniref:DNA-binding response regulator n=1 Tax=Merismopedia glauca CCAP 1448/3 TaxID=1296344 RepID=A0A2T1C797_9CYAN|nr:response regulator transcription factor [Merismopedia glauca]PSB04013.1 DNA-binding response regulator [Merismopedia glauca CCAP 1448/3]